MEQLNEVPTIEELQQFGQEVTENYKNNRRVPVMKFEDGVVYISKHYASRIFYPYEDVKKYITGQNVKQQIKRATFSAKCQDYNKQNIYIPKHPVWNHMNFIEIAFKSLFEPRLQNLFGSDFHGLEMSSIYKYEGGISFFIKLSEEKKTYDRDAKRIFSFEYVMDYPDLSCNIGVDGKGPKMEKAQWNTFVLIHTLLVDILKFLDAEYEKNAPAPSKNIIKKMFEKSDSEQNSIAESVSSEALDGWIRSQLNESQLQKYEETIKSQRNPFRGDPWRDMYDSLKRIIR